MRYLIAIEKYRTHAVTYDHAGHTIYYNHGYIKIVYISVIIIARLSILSFGCHVF